MEKIPLHQWTHKGDKVLLVKCVNEDGKVVDLGGKVKVAAETQDLVEAEVLYYGPWWGAMQFTLDGRVAWIQAASDGSASATGWSGSASATGERGSASATGESGSASATGGRGSASATGERGVASLSGDEGLIEVGPKAIGCVSVDRWSWRLRAGAVVACRWRDGDLWPSKLLEAGDYGTDGQVVEFYKGEPVASKQPA